MLAAFVLKPVTRFLRAALRHLPRPVASVIYPFLRPLAHYLDDTLSLSGIRTVESDPRWPQFEQVFQAIAKDGIEGDYLEFGVYYGRTIHMAFILAKKNELEKIRFFAFDSFQGFPYAEGQFYKGQIAASKGLFSRYIRKAGVDTERVVTVEGVYSDSLNESVKQQHKIEKAAVIHIDCDLYLSAKDVLGFVENLVRPGTILMFDDWNEFDDFAGLDDAMNYGEQRAFLEWSLKDRFEELYHWGSRKAFVMV